MTKIVLILVLFLLVSCGLLTPAQQVTALGAIDTLREAGALTDAQYQAMREAILGSGMLSWLNEAATAATGAALAYVGVQVRRKIDHQRGGYGPEAARPATPTAQ